MPEFELLEDASELAAQAAGGGFAVDPETARRLLDGIRTLRDYLDGGKLHELGILAERPKLSQTTTAQWAGGVLVDTAVDGQGFLTRLGELSEVLAHAESAFAQAMRTYQEMEAEHVRVFR